MWRCELCWRTFGIRDDGINHARAQHSRDYTACRYVPAGRGHPSGGLGRLWRSISGRARGAWRWGPQRTGGVAMYPALDGAGWRSGVPDARCRVVPGLYPPWP
jgi:hypothetical protein